MQNTPGAELSANLALPETVYIVNKAQYSEQDAYSAFAHTSLHQQLEALRISRVFIGGLATDYCVLNTVLDAARLGYQVFVLEDAMCAVNVRPEDENNAKLKMQQAGAKLINLAIIETN